MLQEDHTLDNMDMFVLSVVTLGTMEIGTMEARLHIPV